MLYHLHYRSIALFSSNPSSKGKKKGQEKKIAKTEMGEKKFSDDDDIKRNLSKIYPKLIPGQVQLFSFFDEGNFP